MSGPSRRALLAGIAVALAAGKADAGTPFDDALALARSEALVAGVSAGTIDRAFRDLRPDPRVVALGHWQSEFNRSIGAYVESAASPARVARGRSVGARWSDALNAAQQRYGVPPGTVLALWAVESEYGASTGGYDTIRSLATLASEGPRAELFRRELVAALRILGAGRVAPASLTGSWAGAMGQVQFTPTSYLRFAIDADGDDVADIWRSEPDVIASVANFLRESGWQPDRPWGWEVSLPSRLDLRVHSRPMTEWVARGVTATGGSALPRSGDGALFLPAGIAGPAFLLTANWEVIRAYNTSDSYALAVGLLSDRLAGGGPLSRAWPRTGVLTLAERQEVHRRLATLGFYTGTPDGKFGAQTRDAVRRFQIARGLVPDGYADAALLTALRSAR